MYLNLLVNNLRKSKLVALTTALFIAAAAMLVALAAVLVVNLSGSIDTLMTQARTPHFMQMHSGDLDAARLAGFADRTEAVADYQTVEFLNLDGARFVFDGSGSAGPSLAHSVQDNGLAVQGDRFDFLLDLDGNVITVADGEIYVPIAYMQGGLARIGAAVTVAGKQFTIAGALRDSQMQPLLSSSKRFLVSRADFNELRPLGTVEYLIEFRLHDPESPGAFEAAYAAAGLESNGPTLSFALFRLFNGLSDGLMIALLLLVSALVIAIAFLCIRFTLLAKIEDDYREIGVLKAIGLRVGDIKKIYLVNYAAIAAAGCLSGYGMSFFFRDALLRNIRWYLGESADTSLAPILGILGVALIFTVIMVYINGMLGRFRRISPAEAVRFGVSQDTSGGAKRFRLSRNRHLDINVFLGIKDVLARKSLYLTMLTVLVLAAFIMIVPRNLHNTISSDSFITYMGVGDSDLRIDIQQTDNIAEKTAEIAAAMETDPAISRFVALTTKTFRVATDAGPQERLKIELGDHSVFPLNYIQGRAPATENEIALSVLNSAELGKKTGDSITLLVDGRKSDFTVCGTYSDVTNGGKSAKALFSAPTADIMWSVITARLADPGMTVQKAAEYADSFPFAKVSGIDEYIRQTFGGTIRAIDSAACAAAGIALALAVLITFLFMRMLVAKDRYKIAVLKAFGYTNADIKVQYLARSVFVLVIGLLVGTVLANTVGESLAGAGIASFGGASFKFIVNPVFAYLLGPLSMAGAVLTAVCLGTLDAGRIKISESIKE